MSQRLRRHTGLNNTYFFKKFYSIKEIEPLEKRKNKSTSGDLAKFYHQVSIQSTSLLSKKSHAFFMQLLENQQYNSGLNKNFTQDRFLHKTGSTSYSSGDAGFIIKGDKILIIAGLQERTKGMPLKRSRESLSSIGDFVYRLIKH